MNQLIDKKTEKYRYWITYLLKDMPVGGRFNPGVLHITVVPWFVTDMAEASLIQSFYDQYSGLSSFDVQVGRQTKFKHKREVQVNLVEPIPEILQLHATTLNWINEIGGRWSVKNPHVGDEYVPHIRRRPGNRLSEGQRLHISSISLIKALRQDSNEREVVAKALFNESR